MTWQIGRQWCNISKHTSHMLHLWMLKCKEFLERPNCRDSKTSESGPSPAQTPHLEQTVTPPPAPIELLMVPPIALGAWSMALVLWLPSEHFYSTFWIPEEEAMHPTSLEHTSPQSPTPSIHIFLLWRTACRSPMTTPTPSCAWAVLWPFTMKRVDHTTRPAEHHFSK